MPVMDDPIQTAAQLSAHIKSLRKAKGLTQTQLGQLLGLGQVRIADIEKSPGTISVDQLIKILQALDTRLALQPVASRTPATTQKQEW
jgi:HTH-type transcriptional regulator/antitoxin HipB